MLDTIDQNIFLKNFLADFVKKHGDTTWSGRRYIINSDESASLLVDKLVDAMRENPKFFTYVCNGESLFDKDEVRIPIHESITLLAMLSYFKDKAREIQYQSSFFEAVPEHLQNIIGILQTKYDEMKAKEEEEEERKRLIELEKKEREEYERLRKKYGGQ